MNVRLINIISISILLISASSGIILSRTHGISAKDSVDARQKDISDVFEGLFRQKLHKDTVTLGGNGPFISVLPAVGYSMHTGLIGALVTSTSFYTDNTRNRISRILVNGYYSQFHQYWFTAISNIFLEKSDLHLAGDVRYYKFPTQTYGLGPDTPISNPLQIDYSYLKLNQMVFREISSNLYLGLGYNLDYHWNVSVDSVRGDKLYQFVNNQPGHQSVSSGPSINILYDDRKNAINPKGGTYINFQVRPNMTFLGSDSNWQSLLIELRHYIRLPAASGNILGLWSYNDLTLGGKPPYLDLPGIGNDDYSNTGRGYASGRYTGRNLIYLETEYRFQITRNGLIGGVIFTNAEMLPEKYAEKKTEIIPAGGLGLRIKLNKHSDTNLSIDYGFGVRGSRGFFFNMGEVF